MIDAFPGAFAEALLASTLLMVFVLGIRRPVARRFGAHVAYTLWALPALRLLLPPLPGLRAPIDRLLALLAAPATPLPAAAGGAGTFTPVPAPMVSITAAPSPDWPQLLMIIWIVGVALWALWHVWQYQRFLGAALARATLLMRTDTADILVSDAVSGPLATGIRYPRIFVPVDFHSRYAPAERALALRHEGAHHTRGDIIANVAGLAVLALHWWNPIAHIAWRAFRADQELACDATVLAGANADDRHSYGRAMLKSAASSVPVAASAMNAKTQLKERIAMIKHHDLSARRRMWGTVSAAALVAAGLVVTAAGAPPAAPAPPAPAAASAPPVAPMPPTAVQAPTPPATVAPPAPPAAPPRQIRTLIIKDGKVVENSGSAATIVVNDHVKGDAPGKTVRRMVMVRHGGEGAGVPSDAEIEAMIGDANGDAAHRMIITCKRTKGTNGAADTENCTPASMPSLHATIQESLAAARKSIEVDKGLSDEQRRNALDGLDQAIREMGDKANPASAK